MKPGDVAKRADLVVRLRAMGVKATERGDLTTALYFADAATELAAAERERIALQDKVDRVARVRDDLRTQYPASFALHLLDAALSDDLALDAAVTVALDAERWNAEHGTE